MVDGRITDGVRVAELLASEIDGREDGRLAALALANVDRDVTGTPDGQRAYEIVLQPEPPTDRTEAITLAGVYVHPDRVHLAFGVGVETAVEAASDAALRVRPAAVRPPRTLVFVESGAEVKRAVDVLATVAGAVERQ